MNTLGKTIVIFLSLIIIAMSGLSLYNMYDDNKEKKDVEYASWATGGLGLLIIIVILFTFWRNRQNPLTQ